MTANQVLTAPSGIRRAVLLAACAVAMLTGIWLVNMAGPVAAAHAEYRSYCNGYNAEPKGDPNDHCGSSVYAYLDSTRGWGTEHSACVNGVNTSGELIGAWQCSSGSGAKVWEYFSGSQCLRAEARNNTTGAYNHLYGEEYFPSNEYLC